MSSLCGTNGQPRPKPASAILLERVAYTRHSIHPPAGVSGPGHSRTQLESGGGCDVTCRGPSHPVNTAGTSSSTRRCRMMMRFDTVELRIYPGRRQSPTAGLLADITQNAVIARCTKKHFTIFPLMQVRACAKTDT